MANIDKEKLTIPIYLNTKIVSIGIISSVIVRICTGKIKSVSVVTWIIAVFFLATFLLTH